MEIFFQRFLSVAKAIQSLIDENKITSDSNASISGINEITCSKLNYTTLRLNFKKSITTFVMSFSLNT